jgi:hypothetical protein
MEILRSIKGVHMARRTLLVDNGIAACMTGWLVVKEAQLDHFTLSIDQQRATKQCGSEDGTGGEFHCYRFFVSWFCFSQSLLA